MKDPKKVTASKRLAEWHRSNKEKLAQAAKAQESEPKLTPSQAYGVGAVIAVGMFGLLGYYIYQSKKGDNNAIKVTPVRSVEVQTQKCANKFEMEKSNPFPEENAKRNSQKLRN